MLRLDSNILWTIINLLILYVIARKFLFGPVRKVLAARQAEIDKQFADARTAQEDAQKLKEQYQESLDGAEKERLDILNQARDRAGEEYERILSEAKSTADKLVADAQKSADREQEKRIQQAQEQIADLVVAATAKLMASRQGAEADRELYNQFIAKTGEQCD
ncbi:MAG TPA: F0F1 ATP synthase subunit B [Candidatus Acetatifactor stercoripullorum]|uniref:ATP synthase subunit b n=1 Tax=Candidatus Acetatifactor stercoripullorum TaxID=2838414 RepID=A0A9D1UCA3_9FIRM|nr:F0F1 ATP synthase subunit B [uncultured Acetatifactor sp.]HIW81165.1 F0F1 ATP synthase subunit B [Candidatus Acetatifactor stercoripullorum]